MTFISRMGDFDCNTQYLDDKSDVPIFYLTFILQNVLQKPYLKTPYSWYISKSRFLVPGFDRVGSVEEDLAINLYGGTNHPEREMGNENFNAMKVAKNPNYYTRIKNSKVIFKASDKTDKTSDGNSKEEETPDSNIKEDVIHDKEEIDKEEITLDMHIREKMKFRRNKIELIINSEKSKVGFTYLQIPEGQSQVYKRKVEGVYYLLSTRVYRQSILDRDPQFLDTIGGKFVKSPFQKGNSVSTPYYKCPRWPDEADGWIFRNRPSGWPDMTLIRRTTEVPCVITSACHIPSSENPDIEWMFDFSFPEKFLLKDHITQEQRFCFHVLKLLIDFHTGRRKELSTFILKTIFLYTLEVIPKCHWSSCPSACVLYMVDSLLGGLKEKRIPHYFIPQNNIISYIGSEIIYILIGKVNIVREYPIVSIILLTEGHGVMTTNVTDKIFEDLDHMTCPNGVQDFILNSLIPTYKELTVSSLANKDFRQSATAVTTGCKMLQDLLSGRNSSPHKCMSLHTFIRDATRGMYTIQTWWLCFFVDLFKQENTLSTFINKKSFKKVGDMLEDCPEGDLDAILVPDDILNCYRYVDEPMKLRETIFLSTMCNFLMREHEFSHAAHYLRGLIKMLTKVLDNQDAIMANLVQRQAFRREEESVDFAMQTLVTSWYGSLFHYLDCLYACYVDLDQTDFFQEYIEQFEFVCDTLATPLAYQVLAEIWSALGNTKKTRQAQQKLDRLSKN